MTPEKAAEFKKFIEDMAVASLRCVALAYRPCEMSDVPKEDQRADWVLPEDNLIMLGIVGIKDPCRPGVQDSIRLCIKVCMVTGDNLQTARAIALECGILTGPNVSEPTIIEGKTCRELSDLEREEVANKISVIGRSSPNDKLLLVKAHRSRGHVVAVTGDGTNDAPALHEADIGLSMGIQGTEVAKESSDIIILDDNFATLARVVRWGRSVYANIQFQLTVNVAALIINVVSAVSSGDVPLNAVQLFWVNLMMDTLGALALVTEPPNNHVLQRAPVGRREPLITNIMWRNLLIMAFYQVAILLTLNFKGLSLLRLEHDNPAHAEMLKNTIIFNTFVLCQVFSEFNARKPDELNIFKGIAGNRLFIAIIAITIVLQGPGIRTGFLKDGKPIKLNQGQKVTISTDYTIKGAGTMISTSYHKLAIDMKPGGTILSADSTITLTTLSCDPEQALARCRSENSALLVLSPLMEIKGFSLNPLQPEIKGTKAQSKVTAQTCANLISTNVGNMPFNDQQVKRIPKVTCQRSKQKTLRGTKSIKSIGVLLITIVLLALPLAEARPVGRISEPVICNVNLLPKQINSVCLADQPTSLCCEFIIYAVDKGGCICDIIKHGVMLNTILIHYRSCGGIKPDIVGTIKNCSTISVMPKKKHFSFYWLGLLAFVLVIFLGLMICLVRKQKTKKDTSWIIRAPQESELTRRRSKSPCKRQSVDKSISEQQVAIPVRDDVPFVMTRGRAASLK